eukprot:COSAG01_NODE_18213_length_1092_cov_0.957704_2_plen_170_part_00
MGKAKAQARVAAKSALSRLHAVPQAHGQRVQLAVEPADDYGCGDCLQTGTQRVIFVVVLMIQAAIYIFCVARGGPGNISVPVWAVFLELGVVSIGLVWLYNMLYQSQPNTAAPGGPRAVAAPTPVATVATSSAASAAGSSAVATRCTKDADAREQQALLLSRLSDVGFT